MVIKTKSSLPTRNVDNIRKTDSIRNFRRRDVFLMVLLVGVHFFNASKITTTSNSQGRHDWSSSSNPKCPIISAMHEFHQPFLVLDAEPDHKSFEKANASATVETTDASPWTTEKFCSCMSHQSFQSSSTTPLPSLSLPATIWHNLESSLKEAAAKSTRTCWGDETYESRDKRLFQQFLSDLYESLDIHRLRRTVKAPAHPQVSREILNIVLKRIEDPSKNPPLKIAVFGGSVTQGCWSMANIYGLPAGGINCRIECSWTTKLQDLINTALGHDEVVEVHNLAMGGTDSDVGATLMEYNFFPNQLQGNDFDIIVSAYSSNDGQPAEEQIEDLYEAWQRFVRLAADQRPCSILPLVIQVEDNSLDFLSSSHKSPLYNRLRYSREMVQTAVWNGNVMAMSYADGTRDLVYSNASVKLLAESELHPGQGFHTGVAWVLAWNLMNAMLEACDAPFLSTSSAIKEPLPLLSRSLLFDNVSEIWMKEIKEKEDLCRNDGKITRAKCAFQWLAAVQAQRDKGAIAQKMETVLTSNHGWEAVGFPIRRPRRTWQGSGVHSNFTIQIDNLDMDIDSMMVLYLKSYGPKWESVKLSLVIWGKEPPSAPPNNDKPWIELYQTELKGSHNSETSINYSERIDLGTFLKVGSSIRATFKIISGEQFQVNGMAVCSSSKAVAMRRPSTE